jgi:hypothetical protein
MSSFISVIKVFNGSAIAKNNSISEVINLTRFNAEGFFSLQIEIAGTGNVDVVWAASNDGVNFIVPAAITTTPIFDAFGASSGVGSDGIDIASFDPMLCAYLKLTATENNVNPITSIVCHLAIQ